MSVRDRNKSVIGINILFENRPWLKRVEMNSPIANMSRGVSRPENIKIRKVGNRCINNAAVTPLTENSSKLKIDLGDLPVRVENTDDQDINERIVKMPDKASVGRIVATLVIFIIPLVMYNNQYQSG